MKPVPRSGERLSLPVGAKQVLTSLLRRRGRAVKVLARGFGGKSANYRPAANEREALEAGRMLVLTACPPAVRHITRATALERNRLVLQLASERHIPHIAPGSPLAKLAPEYR